MIADLVATLETPLPTVLPAGGATALFLAGTCFHRHLAVRRVELLVDGARHRPLAAGMPRPAIRAGPKRKKPFRTEGL